MSATEPEEDRVKRQKRENGANGSGQMIAALQGAVGMLDQSVKVAMGRLSTSLAQSTNAMQQMNGVLEEIVKRSMKMSAKITDIEGGKMCVKLSLRNEGMFPVAKIVFSAKLCLEKLKDDGRTEVVPEVEILREELEELLPKKGIESVAHNCSVAMDEPVRGVVSVICSFPSPGTGEELQCTYSRSIGFLDLLFFHPRNEQPLSSIESTANSTKGNLSGDAIRRILRLDPFSGIPLPSSYDIQNANGAPFPISIHCSLTESTEDTKSRRITFALESEKFSSDALNQLKAEIESSE